MGPQVSEEGDHKDLNDNQGEDQDQDHDREHNMIMRTVIFLMVKL